MKLAIRKYRPSLAASHEWREFLREWRFNKFPEQYIGLLHNAANRMSRGHNLDAIQEWEILNFFLFYSKEKNEGISKKAQQQLVGHVLPNWRGFTYPGSEVIHEKFHKVFSKPTVALNYKTYHDSIRNYALKFRHLISGKGAPITGLTLDGQTCHEGVQGLFRSFVLMALEWNVVTYTHHPNVKPLYKIGELEKILEEYLTTPRSQDTWSPDRLSYMFAAGHNMNLGASPETLVSPTLEAQRDMSAFLLLMELRHSVRKLPFVNKPKALAAVN